MPTKVPLNLLSASTIIKAQRPNFNSCASSQRFVVTSLPEGTKTDDEQSFISNYMYTKRPSMICVKYNMPELFRYNNECQELRDGSNWG